LEAFKQLAPRATIVHAEASDLSDDPQLADHVHVLRPRIEIDRRSPEAMLQEAVDLAKSADVVVAVVGEATEMSGEAASRTDISIPESQKKLIRALVDTGKPVALILMSGRPLAIPEENGLPVAILQVWHPGVEAGNAVADVVFGDYNPSGKLTATWPRNIGQIPIYHSVKQTGRPAENGDVFQKFKSNYLDVPNSPLFPFGHGLSYTQFKYSDLELDKGTLAAGESLKVTVKVTNTGDRDGEEVVQLYLRDVVRSITPPVRELKGFQKVSLKKGETQEVVLELGPDALKFYNAQLEFVAEPGTFEVYVGTDSDAALMKAFELK